MKFLRKTLMILMAVILVVPAFAAEKQPVEVNFIEDDMVVDKDVHTILKEGRTFVPYTFFEDIKGFDKYKMEINKGMLTIKGEDREIVLTKDEKVYKVKDAFKSVETEGPATFEDEKGMLYVPFRYVSENTGYGVKWDGDHNIAQIVFKPFIEKRVMVKGDKVDIPAIITMPIQKEKAPLVVMLHGTGSNKDEAGSGYVYMAEEFAKAGIASARFDFRGVGDSKGEYKDYDYETAVADTLKVLEYVKKNENVAPNRVGVMGWSQGGTDAFLAAAKSDEFKSVLTWAGAIDLTNMLSDEDYAAAKKDGYFTVNFDWREPLKFGLSWAEDVKNVKLLDVIKTIKAPILCINGAEDDVVDPKSADEILKASQNDKSKKVVIEGADHTFKIFTDDKNPFAKLMMETVKWFEDTL